MNGFERWFNGLAKWVKCVLAFLGVGIVARIFKYIETKDASPLIGAIIMLFLWPIIAIIDLITQICKNDFTLLYAAGSLNDFSKKEEEKKADTVDAEATEVKDDSDETGEAEPEVKEEEAPDTEEKAE